ncbi:MAG TPA: UMP kinase [Candidatus Dormibacteraeota bacterium]|nr:UMP kinase [Candidatus Dormibacteraeota bacterium]
MTLEPLELTGTAVSSQAAPKPHYRRVVIKISGEALVGDGQFGIDPDVLDIVARELQGAHALGTEIAVMVGGGNIFRGLAGAQRGMNRVTADLMGMLGTVINALALRDALEAHGMATRVLTAIEMHQVAEPYIRGRAIRHLEKGRVVVFCAGSGNPFFTTDTPAALRAAEIGADLLIKATRVDGIYSADPEVDPSATRLPALTYMDVLNLRLQVMDNTAITLCMDNRLPLLVLDLFTPGNLSRAVRGEEVGSLVSDGVPAP